MKNVSRVTFHEKLLIHQTPRGKLRYSSRVKKQASDNFSAGACFLFPASPVWGISTPVGGGLQHEARCFFTVADYARIGREGSCEPASLPYYFNNSTWHFTVMYFHWRNERGSRLKLTLLRVTARITPLVFACEILKRCVKNLCLITNFLETVICTRIQDRLTGVCRDNRVCNEDAGQGYPSGGGKFN